MEHAGDQPVEETVLQLLQEVLLVEKIRDLAVDQVPELVGLLEIIHRNDVVLAALVERLDEIGTDKAGGAGNDVVHIQTP